MKWPEWLKLKPSDDDWMAQGFMALVFLSVGVLRLIEGVRIGRWDQCLMSAIFFLAAWAQGRLSWKSRKRVMDRRIPTPPRKRA